MEIESEEKENTTVVIPKLELNSDYTISERRKWVMDEYLSGRYPYEIRADYESKYGLTKHSYNLDVTWVNTQLKKKGENSVDAIIDQHTDQYRLIYRLALEKKDYRSATAALRNIEDLFRIHKPTTNQSLHLTNKTTTNYNLSNLSFDQIKELLGGDKNTINIDQNQNE